MTPVHLKEILAKDNRYSASAYQFVLFSLQCLVSSFKEPRHVTGQELCLSIKETAFGAFGPLARMVFNEWGLRKTQDFGNVVYNMIEVGAMGRQPADNLSDFDDVFDFCELDDYEIVIPKEKKK